MESKRLQRHTNTVPHILHGTEETIDVPAGENHFHIAQTEGVQHFVFNLNTHHTTLFISALRRGLQENSLAVTINHNAPETRAETMVKTLGMGTSTSSFKGLLKIAPGAHDCESYLNHHALLFDQARSYAWPALEIGNNDVKCSHAATTRTITPADLFYARSRGIPVDAARALLIEAFFADVTYEQHANN